MVVVQAADTLVSISKHSAIRTKKKNERIFKEAKVVNAAESFIVPFT